MPAPVQRWCPFSSIHMSVSKHEDIGSVVGLSKQLSPLSPLSLSGPSDLPSLLEPCVEAGGGKACLNLAR